MNSSLKPKSENNSIFNIRAKFYRVINLQINKVQWILPASQFLILNTEKVSLKEKKFKGWQNLIITKYKVLKARQKSNHKIQLLNSSLGPGGEKLNFEKLANIWTRKFTNLKSPPGTLTGNLNLKNPHLFPHPRTLLRLEPTD